MKLSAFALASLSVLALALPGCADDGDGHGHHVPVTINFMAMVDDTHFVCGDSYDGLGTAGSTLTATDFRFYVSNVRLVDADGLEEPVVLEQDGVYQVDDVVLLDFEDGCGDGGDAALHSQIVGEVHEGEYVGIRFDLGLPFELNHGDIAAAPAPLNVTEMFWNWQGGYKFLRIDGSTDSLASWFFHLGSTGCDGDPATGGVTSCTSPNVASVELDGFDPETNAVVADLALLVASTDLSVEQGGAPGCMSGATDLDCEGLFDAVGLALGGGAAPAQTFFRVE